MMVRLALLVLVAAMGRPVSAWDTDKNARLLRELEERGFNGVALVAEGERVVFEKALGYRRLDPDEPADTSTAYEVGSVSKPFTATAILMLEERGQLSLSDPITKYFPELPYPEVTLERMLSHTAGLYDPCCQPELRPGFDAFYGKSDPPYSNGDYLAFIEKETPALLAAPGEMYRYSNFGYVLLALIVEQVSGDRFDAFLAQNIFEPVGLERTYVLSLMMDPRIDDFAVGYRRDDDGELRVDAPVATPERPSVFAATYGDDEVVSTVDDLFAFGRALKDGELLRPSTLERALTPSRLASGEDGPYGLGFRLQEAANGSTIVYHTGSTNGFLAVCTYPTDDNDVTVVLLTNVIDGGFAELREAVFDLVWSPS